MYTKILAAFGARMMLRLPSDRQRRSLLSAPIWGRLATIGMDNIILRGNSNRPRRYFYNLLRWHAGAVRPAIRYATSYSKPRLTRYERPNIPSARQQYGRPMGRSGRHDRTCMPVPDDLRGAGYRIIATIWHSCNRAWRSAGLSQLRCRRAHDFGTWRTPGATEGDRAARRSLKACATMDAPQARYRHHRLFRADHGSCSPTLHRIAGPASSRIAPSPVCGPAAGRNCASLATSSHWATNRISALAPGAAVGRSDHSPTRDKLQSSAAGRVRSGPS